jgi:hypothetical protein
MTKLLWFAFIATSAAAQPPIDLSGVWEHSKEASSPQKQPIESAKMKIEQKGSTIDITMRAVQRGNLEQMSNRYIASQETRGEMHGVPTTSRTEWDGNTLVVHTVAKMMGRELRLTDRYTLSVGGDRLTITERHQFGTEPEGEDRQVFDRRPLSTWEPDKPPAPAEAVYKNIQVMKGVPATGLRGTMVNLTAWLGVECAYCHVMGQFEKDDKPAKQTARKMFQMMQSNTHDHFPATNTVTCFTCHRGSARPQNLPAQ